jgi:hypothetical protein
MRSMIREFNQEVHRLAQKSVGLKTGEVQTKQPVVVKLEEAPEEPAFEFVQVEDFDVFR